MIAHIRGTVHSSDDRSCIILTPSGLGYQVYLSSRSLQTLPGAGEDTELFICTVVREDALDLYGFLSLEERKTFKVLLNTPKLGPKTALAILSIYPPDKLKGIVQAEDERMLSRVPGIGMKSARRILMDLRDRLKFIAEPEAGPVDKAQASSIREDAISALAGLGYSPGEVIHILDEILHNESDLDVGAAIRAVLKLKAREKQQETP